MSLTSVANACGIAAKSFFVFSFLSILIICPASGREKNEKASDLLKELKSLKRQAEKTRATCESKIDALTVKIQALESRLTGRPSSLGQNELEKLRLEASQFAGKVASVKSDAGDETGKTRKKGNLSLQQMNPEISVTGDFSGMVQSAEGSAHAASGEHQHASWGPQQDSDFMFRGLGIHFESYLDPYSRFKAALHAAPGEHGTGLEEAYYEKFGQWGGTFTAGKFRMPFGVVNRWHTHALDQVDAPLALRRIFGDEGFVETGVGMDWNLRRRGRTTPILELRLTDAENSVIFGSNGRNRPALLVRYKLFTEVNKDLYYELGFSGIYGYNAHWEYELGGIHDHVSKNLGVFVAGVDFTRLMEPAREMRYRNSMFRTELYGVRKKIMAPDGTGIDDVMAWGGYVNFHWKLDRTRETGFRVDYFEPDCKPYAASDHFVGSTLASDVFGTREWQISPYFTWHQSPWVRYRMQFDLKSGSGEASDEKRLMFQLIWAAGPHKHEKY